MPSVFRLLRIFPRGADNRLFQLIRNTHGKNGFVIPTKSFVKKGDHKNILLQQQNVWFYQHTVSLLRQNFWLQQQFFFVVPNFVAVTKPFFFRAIKNGLSPT